MRPARVWAIMRKEFIHVLRDPRSLGMAVAIPMLLLVLFGYALALDVDNVPLALWDQDGTLTSREFASRFSGSRYFNILRHVRSYREAERAIDTGRVLAALIIPAGFADDIAAGRRAKVQVIVDGSDANTATLAMGYARVVALTWSQVVNLDAAQRRGAVTLQTPIDLRPRIWFNADMESRNFIIPGLIAVIMMVVAALLTSLTIAREWEQGTMEQLISTPVRARELVLGKLLPYFAIGMFDVAIAVMMGEYLFHVPLRGNLALVFAMAAIFLGGALAMGLVISILTRNQLLASQVAMVSTFLPSFLLSGFMYSISNMPAFIQAITWAVPARYFIALLRGIYLKGLGLEFLVVEAVVLALFGAVVIAIATLKFRKRVTV